MFTAGEDGNLELQIRGPPSRQCASIYGEAPYYPADLPSMTTLMLGSVRSSLNPYIGPYTLAVMTSWGHPIKVRMFQPSTGMLSPTSSGASTNQDLAKDYPEIGGNIYWNPATEALRISMVGLGRAYSYNSSIKYPMIRGSTTSNAWTPSNQVVQNLHPDFNTIRLQTIMESIQRLAPKDSSLVALAQQGAEAVVQIAVVEPSRGDRCSEPSVGN
jgi:hypothetical protein